MTNGYKVSLIINELPQLHFPLFYVPPYYCCITFTI